MSICHQEIFNELYTKFKKTAASIECKAENFMDFLVTAMEQVETYAKDVKDRIVLRGLEKKELVLDMMNKFFADVKEIWTNGTEEVKQDWEKIQIGLKCVMDKAIDILVQASRGVFHLNEKIKAKCGCAKKAPVNKARNAPKDITEVTALTDQIHNEVKASIVNKQFGANNFIVLITIVVQIVEKLGNLAGPEKKQVAVAVIGKLIMEIPMPDGDRDAIRIVVDTTLSKTIDYIIMAANGELNFGAMAEQIKKIFNCC